MNVDMSGEELTERGGGLSYRVKTLESVQRFLQKQYEYHRLSLHEYIVHASYIASAKYYFSYIWLALLHNIPSVKTATNGDPTAPNIVNAIETSVPILVAANAKPMVRAP